MDDGFLVEAARGGDETAFGRLVERYKDAMKHKSLRNGGRLIYGLSSLARHHRCWLRPVESWVPQQRRQERKQQRWPLLRMRSARPSKTLRRNGKGRQQRRQQRQQQKQRARSWVYHNDIGTSFTINSESTGPGGWEKQCEWM